MDIIALDTQQHQHKNIALECLEADCGKMTGVRYERDIAHNAVHTNIPQILLPMLLMIPLQSLYLPQWHLNYTQQHKRVNGSVQRQIRIEKCLCLRLSIAYFYHWVTLVTVRWHDIYSWTSNDPSVVRH